MIANSLIGLGFTPNVDFIAQDDGQGVYIREWLSSKPRPTDEELEQGLINFNKQQEIKIRLDAIAKYMGLVKQVIKENRQDISPEEMTQFISMLDEFRELGEVEIENWPLVHSQVQEWISQDKLPPLP